MKQISSKSNSIIKKAVKVLSGSSDENLIMVEGHKLLEEALKSGAKVDMLFVEDPSSLRDKTDLESKCYQISRGLMRELSTVKTPNEIIAFLTPPPLPSLNKVLENQGVLVALDRLQDPGNIGTIIRTSEAMGALAVILLEGCCNSNNHKVIRAAMGSNFRIPVFSNIKSEKLFSLLKENDFSTYCADMQGKQLPGHSFPKKVALFLGQEGSGLSETVIENCNHRIAIPMFGQVESLNVATSAAMCLYEWARNKFV